MRRVVFRLLLAGCLAAVFAVAAGMEQGVIGPLSGAAWCAALIVAAWICGILGEAMYRV